MAPKRISPRILELKIWFVLSFLFSVTQSELVPAQFTCTTDKPVGGESYSNGYHGIKVELVAMFCGQVTVTTSVKTAGFNAIPRGKEPDSATTLTSALDPEGVPKNQFDFSKYLNTRVYYTDGYIYLAKSYIWPTALTMENIVLIAARLVYKLYEKKYVFMSIIYYVMIYNYYVFSPHIQKNSSAEYVCKRFYTNAKSFLCTYFRCVHFLGSR